MSKKREVCKKCGANTYNIKRHIDTQICKAKQKSIDLEKDGYFKCLGTNSIIKRAGIPVTYESVASGPNVANAYYAPKWAVAIALHRNLHPEERVAALKKALKNNRKAAIDTLLRLSQIDLEWWSAVGEFHYTDVESNRAPLNKVIWSKRTGEAVEERRNVMTSILNIALSDEEEA